MEFQICDLRPVDFVYLLPVGAVSAFFTTKYGLEVKSFRPGLALAVSALDLVGFFAMYFGCFRAEDGFPNRMP